MELRLLSLALIAGLVAACGDTYPPARLADFQKRKDESCAMSRAAAELAWQARTAGVKASRYPLGSNSLLRADAEWLRDYVYTKATSLRDAKDAAEARCVAKFDAMISEDRARYAAAAPPK